MTKVWEAARALLGVRRRRIKELEEQLSRERRQRRAVEARLSASEELLDEAENIMRGEE
jgi:hypothetical protein